MTEYSTRQIELREQKLYLPTYQSKNGTNILKFKAELSKRIHILKQIFEDLYGDERFDDAVYTKLKNVFSEIDDWLDSLESISRNNGGENGLNVENNDHTVDKDDPDLEQFLDTLSSDEDQYGIDSRQTIQNANCNPFSALAVGNLIQKSKEGILRDFELVQVNDLVPKECGLNTDCGKTGFIKNELEWDDVSQNPLENDNVDSIQTMENANHGLVSSITKVRANDLMLNECGSSEVKVYYGERSFIKNELEFDEIDQNFGENNDVTLDCKNKTDVLRFKCDVCGDKFVQRDRLEVHQKLNSVGRSLKRDISAATYNQSNHLNVHLKTHSVEMPFKCDICEKGFYQRRSLKTHHTVEKPFTCETCGKSFSQSGVLKNHTRIHIDEKQFLCDVCGKKFVYKVTLENHSRIHTGEKPFKCNICEKSFAQGGVLKTHLETHSDARPRPFKCDTCQKTFLQSASFKSHLRVHSGEKRFQCDVCGKRFVIKGNLDAHSRIHTGEKPFKCEICGKAFTQSSILTRHLRIHFDQKPPKSVTETSNVFSKKKSRTANRSVLVLVPGLPNSQN